MIHPAALNHTLLMSKPKEALINIITEQNQQLTTLRRQQTHLSEDSATPVDDTNVCPWLIFKVF